MTRGRRASTRTPSGEVRHGGRLLATRIEESRFALVSYREDEAALLDFFVAVERDIPGPAT